MPVVASLWNEFSHVLPKIRKGLIKEDSGVTKKRWWEVGGRTERGLNESLWLVFGFLIFLQTKREKKSVSRGGPTTSTTGTA